jgi:hypothetical protein
MNFGLRAFAALAIVTTASVAFAEPTRIDVRVLSKAGKFVGTSMGGAEIEIRDAESGDVLARGRTAGSTGDTAKIMKAPARHHDPVSTADAAVFRAEIDLDEPRRVEVVARGPLAQPQAIQIARATQWVVPGKHLTGGDGFRLELPGFVVDVLDPPAHRKLAGTPQTVELRANVVLMCGCPIEPGGLWDANGYEVRALVRRNGEPIPGAALAYAGATSQFAGTLELAEPGAYEITVYAYDPATGNTGLDRTSVVVEAAAD